MPQVSTVLTLGLIFHLVFIWCVFDCYFTSPVIHGMRHFSAGDGDADRLVLFVADGLRADLFFNRNPFPSIPDSPIIVAPYLHDIMLKRGAFGVSHTRVPTESRPGHVALIAGMYEDVSAVTKGWKTNPVDFDSVFNQSTYTFSFGSPDILPMFAKGAQPGRVQMWCYDEEEENFTRDASELDVWVIDHLRDLLVNASSDSALDSRLRSKKTVFFLHLLGLDTTGHSYRPHSKEYLKNIQIVDNIVEQTEKLFLEFYSDQKTAYVFTADHGMSNIGNHGDGNPDNTRTPLVAWGAGVRGPMPDVESETHDDFSSPWPDELKTLLRQDVQQADIAPLMSALLGTDFAANSVGVLPDIQSAGFLDFSQADGPEKRARLAFTNARVIFEQYLVKRGKWKCESARKRKLAYEDCVAQSADQGCSPESQTVLYIQELLGSGKWDDASEESSKLIGDTIRGLRYLQTYDRAVLAAIAFFAYLGWSGYSAAALLLKESLLPASVSTKATVVANSVAIIALVVFWVCFYLQSEPWTYFLYIAFPIYFWRTILLHASGENFLKIVRLPKFTFLVPTKEPTFKKIFVASVLALQGMVWAYTNRWIWSVGFAMIGVAWPLTWPQVSSVKNKELYFKWAVACLITAIFPLRDVEQNENFWNVIAGGVLLIVGGKFWASRLSAKGVQHMGTRVLEQLVVTGASTVVSVDSILRLQAKSGLPVRNQILGWVCLVSSTIIPFLTSFRRLPTEMKLLTLILTFAPCFVILSINAEGLFYAAYCSTLIMWIEVETQIRKDWNSKATTETNDGKSHKTIATRKQKLQMDDVRIALFFLFFVQVAFFGTGNVASISSFYLEPVYRLVPIFNPFLMAALLLFKIFAPYVVLAAAFAALNAQLNLPPFSLFMIALSLTDVMTITFFVKVTDTGSWLEIGQTISFFVISSLLLVWSAGICALGEWLMREDTRTTARKIE